jgi:GTP-binding protein
MDFRYRRHYRAQRGRPGEGRDRTGARGEAVRIPVPTGTLVYDDRTGELLGDLVEDGEELIVVRGGRGGRGNTRFKSATHQAPRRADPGRPGEERRLRLELKLLADVGLVGFPNAGKSTLLAALTSARPKVADYPFTTLVPNLGILDLGGYVSCTIADIPGLIEGASEGRGLGHEFLRHVERCRVLVFLLDVTDEPRVRLEALEREVRRYQEALGRARRIVCLNKTDLLVDLGALSEEMGSEALPISALTGAGLDRLRAALKLELSRARSEVDDAARSSSGELPDSD